MTFEDFLFSIKKDSKDVQKVMIDGCRFLNCGLCHFLFVKAVRF